MKVFTKIAFAIALFMVPMIGTAATIQNMTEVPVPTKLDGSFPKIEETKEAIINGCRARGWVPQVVEGENKIVASIDVRGKHQAKIEIPYSENSYSIIYVSSNGLKYDAEKNSIHRNYNKWISMLNSSIQQEYGSKAK